MKSRIMMTCCVGLLLFLTIASAVSLATVPKQINYQGFLTDADGNPANGYYDMLFKIYMTPTEVTPLWTQDETVTVTNGIYNVILGQEGNELDPGIFDGDLYLGVTVGSDDEMTPRQKFTATAFAMKAARADSVADGAVSSVMIADGAVESNKVANNAITSSKILDSSITAADISDGSGSGLDADQLDGLDASHFMSAGADNWVNESGDNMTGPLTATVFTLSSNFVYAIKGSLTGSGPGAGVYGYATGSNHGIHGGATGENGVAVYGEAGAEGMEAENYGGYFVAYGDFGKGVYGESSGGFGVGVYGETSGSIGKGVYGRALGSSGFGVGVWGSAEGTTSAGVRGSATGSSGMGVHGETTGASGKGVYGKASNEGNFQNYGGYFIANGTSGVGIYADGGSSGYAAVFHGNVLIKSESTGESVMEFGEGFDYAEGFDISEVIKVARGSVLIIDADNPGRLKLSDSPYDTKVAGIVAGGKGLGSGVRLGAGQFDYDVALAGRVYCNVDTTYGEVTPGDLLTTSPTPGYAMVVKDQNKSQGAILGKAMESLPQGKKDQILVLVTLQ